MDKFKDALKKKALGYDVDEVVEEYVTDENGEEHLQKRKVTKKHNPPDLGALKVLLDSENADKKLSDLTDAELEKEKQRLLKLLRNKEEKNENDIV